MTDSQQREVPKGGLRLRYGGRRTFWNWYGAWRRYSSSFFLSADEHAAGRLRLVVILCLWEGVTSVASRAVQRNAAQCKQGRAGGVRPSSWDPEEEAIGPLDKGGPCTFPWKGDALRRCESATTTAAKK